VSQLELPADSVDFICSNNTFEHIYPDPLARILAQLHRVLKPGGIMSHFIDMSDHFSHLDQSITPLNFLQFSQRTWARIDNSIQPQNRWRLSDYRRLYARQEISIAEEIVITRDEEALAQTPVHAEFTAYDRADLATLHAYVISVGAASA
jgi:SAM-dependent methyltransferase